MTPKGTFTGMSWLMRAATMDDFVERHRMLSTSPDSGFVRTPIVQRRDATGADAMRGLTLTRVGEGAAPPEVLIDREEWFGALAEIFDLRLDGIPREMLDRLWDRCLDAHREWDAAGRP